MHGVWAPTITPLDRAGNIDHNKLTRHVRWLLDHGCHGVALFGTTGEAPSFTSDERKAALEALVAADIGTEQLVVGTGCTAVRDTIELTRHAVDLGVRRALVLPPFYLKPVTDDGLIRSFSEVIEGVGADDLEVMAYHFPRLSGIPIPTTVLTRLRHDYGSAISGVKDSTGDPASLTEFLDACPELDVFPGSETLLLAGLRLGASGVITAGANVNPRMLRAIYDTPDTADGLQDRATAIRAEIQAHGTVPATKALLAHYHGDEGWLGVRAPLAPEQVPDGAALASAISALGYEWPQLP